MAKSSEAFRTISEVADWLGVQTHVLRFWESKFTQVKPTKRAGGRRYYRPSDMLLLGGIKRLLHDDGMTIKGAQKVLRERGVKEVSALCLLSVDDQAQDTASPATDASAPASTPEPASVAETAPLPKVSPVKEAPELDFGEASKEDAAPKPDAPQVGLPSFMQRPTINTSPTPAAPTGIASPATPPEPAPAAATHAPAASGPDIANLPLTEALAHLSPGQVDPAKLRAIRDKLRSLSTRMAG